MNTAHTVSSYLIDRLYSAGVRHIFGVPGDYALGFYHELDRSKLKVINTCDEQGAGFAADAYARVSGLGVVCITYCVGGLKVANTTAQAFAEKSPVVVISGAPGTDERMKRPLLHHKVREFDTQQKIFELLTVASTVIDDPQTACREIDRVLNNRGYGTERPMLDGSFNDIHLWRYSRIPEVLNAGKGFDVRTEDQLEQALQEARENTESFSILDVHIDPQDRSMALQRLTDALGKRVKS